MHQWARVRFPVPAPYVHLVSSPYLLPQIFSGSWFPLLHLKLDFLNKSVSKHFIEASLKFNAFALLRFAWFRPNVINKWNCTCQYPHFEFDIRARKLTAATPGHSSLALVPKLQGKNRVYCMWFSASKRSTLCLTIFERNKCSACPRKNKKQKQTQKKKKGPEKYWQIWCYIKFCFKQRTLAYVCNCHIMYVLLAKDRNAFHKIVLKI